VNYFEFHIADYQRKTAHLSLAEHGAYSLMMQTFYASERALPANRKILYRLLRADSKVEKAAVEAVIEQFWQEEGVGLINKRAMEMVAEYRQWVDKQKANGKRGGRPNKTQGLSQTKPNGGDMILDHDLDHDLDMTPHMTSQVGSVGTARRGGGAMDRERRAKTVDELEREEAAREESARKSSRAQALGNPHAGR
jgi:uncharacterized protein YdaU (DUF1376 family)